MYRDDASIVTAGALYHDVDMDREMSRGYGRTTTWNKLLVDEMARNKEVLDDVCWVSRRLGGTPANFHFYAWSDDYVYSAWESEGSAEVISVPRNPW